MSSGLLRVFLVVAVLMVGASALAQPHERTVGRYTLRASVAPSTSVAASTARAHGVVPAPGRSLLNVTLVERSGGAERTVAASVGARIVDLLGLQHDVYLRPVRAQGRVSYFGTFTHARGAALDFSIDARPQGADRPVELSFRERMAR